MRYLKTYIPVLFLVIAWLLFKFVDSIGSNELLLYLVLLITLIGMIIIAIKSNSRFIESVIMLVVYNIVNYYMYKFLYSTGVFLQGLDYFICLALISVLFFIIMSIRCLSYNKKEDTK